jgi:hypothetical protein
MSDLWRLPLLGKVTVQHVGFLDDDMLEALMPKVFISSTSRDLVGCGNNIRQVEKDRATRHRLVAGRVNMR